VSDMTRCNHEAYKTVSLSESDGIPTGDIHIGYIVDLNKYTFDDVANQNGDSSSWIQAFPYGEWSHPQYGKIKMDASRAATMAAGINQGVRGQDLPINYDHGEQRKDAAGWIQRADVRPDGLWLNIEWTREAFDKIKNKAYRYFSPEYANKWKHPASGQVFQDVFFGGALTNMPHLKGILPLNLSEYASDEENDDKKTAVRSFMEIYAPIYGIKFDESTTDESLKNDIARKLGELAHKPEAKVSSESNVSEQPGSMLLEYKEADWSRVEIMTTDSPKSEIANAG
jgi:phage I-like protein